MAKEDTKTNEDQNANTQAPAKGEQQRSVTRSGGRPLGLRGMPADVFRGGPFSLLRRMSEEMDRVMGEFAPYRGGEGADLWSPALEVSEHDNNYIVRAELPGIKADDVKLEITDDAIILQGERKTEREESKGGIHHTERHYGHFYRSVPLPEGANTGDAKAKFENGVLEVTVPVAERRSKPREIPIEAGAEPQPVSSRRT